MCATVSKHFVYLWHNRITMQLGIFWIYIYDTCDACHWDHVKVLYWMLYDNQFTDTMTTSDHRGFLSSSCLLVRSIDVLKSMNCLPLLKIIAIKTSLDKTDVIDIYILHLIQWTLPVLFIFYKVWYYSGLIKKCTN